MTRVEKTLRNAALLLLLGGGAAIWIYIQDIQPRDENYQAEQSAKRLFRFGRSHVVSGTLYTKNATLSFGRSSGDNFRITAPVDAPADAKALSALLDRMAGIKLDETLTENATLDELRSWGLHPPQIQLSVDLQNGQTHKLLIGAHNTLVNGYPITDATKKRVGLSSPDFYWAFDRPPEEFRSHKLLEDHPSGVASITVHLEDNHSYELSRTSTSADWMLSTPTRTEKASTSRVGLFIATFLRRIQVTRFITDHFDPANQESTLRRYGLDAPKATLTWKWFDGTSTRLFIGQQPLESSPPKESSASEVWTAHIEGNPTVVEVDESIALEIERKAPHFADLSLSRFNPLSVEHFELYLSSQTPYSFRRQRGESNPGWVLEKAPKRPLKTWRIDAILRAFSFLDGKRIYRDTPSKKDIHTWELSPPHRRLVFRGSNGVLADIRLGKLWDDEHLFVASGAMNRVMLLSKASLGMVPSRFEELVDPSGSGETPTK